MTKIINKFNNNQEAIIIHPGEILREELLKPYKITAEQLAHDIKVNPQIIQDLITEKRDLDKELATRLALYFDMSTEFWLGIQHDYEQDCIENLRTSLSKEITPHRISCPN